MSSSRILSKRCPKCGAVKDAKGFYGDAKRKDGLYYMCKSCTAAYNKARYDANPDKFRAQSRKAATKRRAKDKATVYARTKEWKSRNHEALRAYQRRYNAENRERIRAKHREWLERNREHYAEWESAYKARRYAKMKGSADGGTITHREIAERDGWRCHICGKRVTRKNWSLDHLVPVSKGGPHTRENIALAHYVCNCRRQAGRTPAQLRLIG